MRQTQLSILTALLTLPFLVACGPTDRERIEAAARATALAESTRELPSYPDDCRKNSYSGVREGDRLDVAVLKTDQALARQNARTGRCAGWYDQLSAEFKKGPEE